MPEAARVSRQICGQEEAGSARGYRAKEIAQSLGVHRANIVRRADGENWPYRDEIGNGGRRKVYLFETLPREVRRAIEAWERRREAEALQRLREEEVKVRVEEAPKALALPEKERRVALARGAVLGAAERFCQRAAGGDARATGRVEQLKEFYGRLNALLQAQKNPPRPPFIKGGREVLADLEVLQEFAGLDFEGEEIPEVLACIKKVSWQTAYKWKAAQRERAELMALARNYYRDEEGNYQAPGLGAKTITPDMKAFVRALFVKGDIKLWPALHGNYRDAGATRRSKIKCNMARVYDRLKLEFARHTHLPHYGHFTKWLTDYLRKNQENLAAICLPSFWMSTFQPKSGLASENVSYWGEKWEIDGTPADVMFADGRHEILAAIDVFSRDLIVEMDKHASSMTVARLMRQGLLRWGVPERIKGDRGTIFKSAHIEIACKQLEIDFQHCQAYAGYEKPHIESAFGSMARMLFEALPWFIGHNPGQRKRIQEFEKFHEVFYHAKNPVKLSCEATAGEFQEVLNNWLEKVYRVEAHKFKDCKALGRSGLVWERQANSPRRAPQIGNPDYLDDLLSPAFRRVYASGVQWDGMPVKYCPDSPAGMVAAQDYQGQAVLFKPSLADVSRGALWELLPNGAPGPFICRVQSAIRGGMPLAEHQQGKKHILKAHKGNRKAAELLFRLPGYDRKLAEMPQPKVAVAGFGAPDYQGGAYEELRKYDRGLHAAPDPARDRQIASAADGLADVRRQRAEALEELKQSPEVQEYAAIIAAVARGEEITPEQRQIMKYFNPDTYRRLEAWFQEVKMRAVQERCGE